MKLGSHIKVGLTARLTTGAPGGVEQVLIGLANGLSSLDSDGEEFHFLTIKGHDDWLRPYVRGSCRIIDTPQARASRGIRGPLKRTIPASQKLARVLPALPGVRMHHPTSDGTLESLGVDVIHFATQDAFPTDLPSIYQPHDLLHVHLPHFLTPRQREYRERTYPAHCERASFVVAMTTWGKNDLVRHFGLPAEKVRVIPWAPVISAYKRPSTGALVGTAGKYRLSDGFLFYPAQTWPHKNHLGLLEAISILKDRHKLRLQVVCSGVQSDFYPHIARRAARLRISDQVRFVGFVSSEDIQCLYATARALVFPSYFEGWGMPICEAFASDLPVVCSKAAALPDLVGDAALLFDPNDPNEMADVLARVWQEEELRADLIGRGRRRVANFSWERTARLMRVAYREAAGKALSAEDEALLDERALV